VNDELVVYADQEAESIKEQNRETVEPLVHSLEKLGFQVSPECTFGDPAKEIERFVEERDIDLVAMTTHGREGLSRLLHGSVAQHILHHLYVPILLLREVPEDWLGGALGE
jgi:nucleotide-binding universal stress UspA family protein